MALYRQLLAEKSILFDQLHASVKQLVHRDDLVLKNEQELIRLKYENDLQKLEVYQKRELLLEMEGDLEREKGRYKALKIELRRLEKQTVQLTQTLKQKEDELDQLEEILNDRDNMIDELERQISERIEVQSSHSAAVASVRSLKPKKKLNWYKPIKGDLIDELIAKYFNAMSRPMPVKRLGDGFYIFGTRKIYVKLLVGKLVVRVGGGFMSIDEFMS
jgi:chromosome segregation ATPase